MIRKTTALVLISVIGLLCTVRGTAADPPSDELLDAIFPVLRGKTLPLPPVVNTFRKSTAPADPVCGLIKMDLVQVRGRSSRLFELLAEPSESGDQPKNMLIRLNTLAIDADGSHRAYHPDDPFGNRCKGSDDPASSICAVDSISNAEVHIYEHNQRVSPYSGKPAKPNPAFITAWKSLWSDIAARKDNWVDLRQYFGPRTPENIHLYYSKQTDRAVTFDAAIIPFKGNFPCQHKESPGEYFVAATTKRETASSSPEDACSAADYFDAMQIPFMVLPGAFNELKMGDVAIGLAVIDGTERVAFGAVGDRGPAQQIGEASIAFAQKLRGTSEIIKNTSQADALQIETGGRVSMLGVLVLGGTAPMFGSDYSPQNIERVASAALKDWNSANPRRLQACMSIATPNPLRGK